MLVQNLHWRTALLLSCFWFIALPICFGDDANSVLQDWDTWVRKAKANVRSASLVYRSTRERDEQNDTKFSVGFGRNGTFCRTRKYYNAKAGRWNEDVSAGNTNYAFTVTDRSGRVELAALNLSSDDKFDEVFAKSFNGNPLFMNVLLTASFDSIHTLVMDGKVLRTEFPERDTAVLTVEVPEFSKESSIPEVRLEFVRSETWYPSKVSWSVATAKSTANGKLGLQYSYRDWTEVDGIRLPTKVLAKRSLNGSDQEHEWQVNYELRGEELKDTQRYHLSDFNLPEPRVPIQTPAWVWGLAAGIVLLVISGILRFARK